MMNRNRTKTVLALAAVAMASLVLTTVSANAATIGGVTIEDVSSELAGFDRLAVYTIDGSGFDEVTGFHSFEADGVAWLNQGSFADPNDANLPGAVITFDLEANYDLTSVTVWNYNEANVRPLTGRGADLVEILVADSEGGAFVSLGDFNLTEAPGVEDVNFGQLIDLTGFAAADDTRLVRFNIASGLPTTDVGFVGLSEVRFGNNISPGDVDGNGTVEILDFNIIRDNLFETEIDGQPVLWGDGDLTGDGLVGFEDFREWKEFAPPEAVAAASFAVPEPGTLVLAGCLLLALTFRTRGRLT